VSDTYRNACVVSQFTLAGPTDTLRLELVGSGIQASRIEPHPIENQIRINSYGSSMPIKAWQATLALPNHLWFKTGLSVAWFS